MWNDGTPLFYLILVVTHVTLKWCLNATNKNVVFREGFLFFLFIIYLFIYFDKMELITTLTFEWLKLIISCEKHVTVFEDYFWKCRRLKLNVSKTNELLVNYDALNMDAATNYLQILKKQKVYTHFVISLINRLQVHQFNSTSFSFIASL